MAKYRWGFETIENDNPIFTECFPIVEDGTSLDYAQQTNDVFYRAKLNGTITFRFDTFDYIIDAGYNAVHIVVLQRFDETEINFVEVWRGKFTLTDCTINYDTHTIDVTPETIDRYTAVLDNLEKEYNLVKLKAQMKPVNILVRPCIQIYRVGATKISNYIGGNGWESDCEAAEQLALENVFGFVRLRDCIWFSIDYNTGTYAGKNTMYYGRFLMTGQDEYIFPIDGRVYNSDGTYTDDNTLECRLYRDTITQKWVFLIRDIATQTQVVRVWYNQYDSGDNYFSIEWASNIDNVIFNWDIIYGRTICQAELQSITISGTTYNLIDIPTEDIARNRNYNKILPYAAAVVVPDIDTSIEPTTWPQDILGYYFEKPTNTPTRHHFTVNIEEWKGVSYWWYAGANAAIVENTLTTERTIKDCYDYRSVIQKLLGKTGVYPNYIISYCLGGTNDYVGTRTDLRITPRSNVISSYYDTPAQNAPITLAKVLNMLKIVYQCYWYIDNSGNFHIEHISFFDNGYSTTEDEPELIVDLESELHTRTLNNKVFGQNQVKFDKQDMPEQYTFGWADSVTRPFIGYPINCLDKYVQQGNISEQNAADFDSDVDYVLSSPNDVSKDGFFLFALPAEGLDYSDTLKVENVLITDEIGDTFEVSIQNADAAFVKIHKTWWRYHLPCENINVNNEDTVALTTGSYKLQTLEFTDTAMADIIGNVDNCNKIIRTQQGDGHVKTLSINLNSLATKADLLFNFVGRWYYLRGTALGASITISVNGESVTIDVSNNTFKYRYKEPIAALDFSGTDVVSVNFADCDSLNNLTSADEMFKNCAELLAVDFANKTFGAVTTANDMFADCSELTTLICPPTASWKADLDFSDCPNLTLESLNDLINDFLYSFDSGTHTITPNSTMWNALDGAVQDDIIARAMAKGWTIAIPAQYSVTGTSAGSVVYATINGTAVEIDVVGGNWSYDYNTPISSIAFTNDTNLQTIDFSLSDGLASLTSLDNAFKGCTMLTAVDFTNCDLTNVVSASDCFAACSALFNVTIPANSWKPDVDFSDCALIVYAEMADIINSLYTYATGTHTITFNQTTWDSLSVAQQQTIFDAAQLKGWTTNAVVIIYHIRGVTNVLSGSVTFNVQFIADGVPSVETSIICETDAQGAFDYTYSRKKIYSLASFNYQISGSPFLISVDFSDADDLDECISLYRAFSYQYIGTILESVSLRGKKLNAVLDASYMFNTDTLITHIDMSDAEFNSVTDITQAFFQCPKMAIIDLPKATFASVTTAQYAFANNNAGGSSDTTTTINLPNATFASVTDMTAIFRDKRILATLNMQNANCGNLATSTNMFQRVNSLVNFNLSQTSTAISPTSSAANAPMDLRTAPLSYQSMLNVANWLSDLSGQTAHTCTFKTSAWNALSSAEQATIQGILSGKNWNLATA